MLAQTERNNYTCCFSSGYWVALAAYLCLVAIDIASFGADISMLLLMDACWNNFRARASVGVAFALLSIIVCWARYAPDGCSRTLPCGLGMLVMAGVFAVPLAVYADGFHRFAQYEAQCQASTTANWDTMRSTSLALVVLNASKYPLMLTIDFIFRGCRRNAPAEEDPPAVRPTVNPTVVDAHTHDVHAPPPIPPQFQKP